MVLNSKLSPKLKTKNQKERRRERKRERAALSRESRQAIMADKYVMGKVSEEEEEREREREREGEETSSVSFLIKSTNPEQLNTDPQPDFTTKNWGNI